MYDASIVSFSAPVVSILLRVHSKWNQSSGEVGL